jgi:hypothetical protein
MKGSQIGAIQWNDGVGNKVRGTRNCRRARGGEIEKRTLH